MNFKLVPTSVEEIDRRGRAVLDAWRSAIRERELTVARGTPETEDPAAVKWMRDNRGSYIDAGAENGGNFMDPDEEPLKSRLPVMLMPLNAITRGGKKNRRGISYDSAYQIAAYNAQCQAIHALLLPLIQTGQVVETTSQHSSRVLTDYPNTWWLDLGGVHTLQGPMVDAGIARVLGLADIFQLSYYTQITSSAAVPEPVFGEAGADLMTAEYGKVVAERIKWTLRFDKSVLHRLVDMKTLRQWKPKMSDASRLAKDWLTLAAIADVGLWPEMGTEYGGYQPDIDFTGVSMPSMKLMILASYLNGYANLKWHEMLELRLIDTAGDIQGVEGDLDEVAVNPRTQRKVLSWLTYRTLPADIVMQEHYDDETGRWLGKWYEVGVSDWDRYNLALGLKQQAVAVVPTFSLGSFADAICPICGNPVRARSTPHNFTSPTLLVWNQDPDVPDMAYHLLCSGLMLDPSDDLPAVMRSKRFGWVVYTRC